MSEQPERPSGRMPAPLRWGLIGVGAIAVLIVLFTVVFPWIERNLSNPTLGP